MNARLYKYGFLSCMLLILFFCIYLINILRIDNADAFSNPYPTKCKPTPDYSFLSVVNSKDVKKTFPKSEFIKSANWWCNETVVYTLNYLDSINPGKPEENEDALILCLTDSNLLAKSGNDNLDSLCGILTIAEKYLVFAETTPSRKFFFKAVGNAWIGYVSNRLTAIVKQKNSVKYSFKCQYLRSQCLNLGSPPNFGNTTIDKIVIDFSNQKWKYLILDKYWYGTSILFKVVTIIPALLFFSVFLYGCISFYQKYLKK
jgi:hypothetical protein